MNKQSRKDVIGSKQCFKLKLPKKNYVSVATDEGPSPKLALSKGGSRTNIES